MIQMCKRAFNRKRVTEQPKNQNYRHYDLMLFFVLVVHCCCSLIVILMLFFGTPKKRKNEKKEREQSEFHHRVEIGSPAQRDGLECADSYKYPRK